MVQELTSFIQREGLFVHSEQSGTGIYPVPDELITQAKVYFLQTHLNGGDDNGDDDDDGEDDNGGEVCNVGDDDDDNNNNNKVVVVLGWL